MALFAPPGGHGAHAGWVGHGSVIPWENGLNVASAQGAPRVALRASPGRGGRQQMLQGRRCASGLAHQGAPDDRAHGARLR